MVTDKPLRPRSCAGPIRAGVRRRDMRWYLTTTRYVGCPANPARHPPPFSPITNHQPPGERTLQSRMPCRSLVMHPNH